MDRFCLLVYARRLDRQINAEVVGQFAPVLPGKRDECFHASASLGISALFFLSQACAWPFVSGVFIFRLVRPIGETKNRGPLSISRSSNREVVY